MIDSAARLVGEISSDNPETRLWSVLSLLTVCEGNYRAVRLMLTGLRSQIADLGGDADFSAVIACLDRAISEYSTLANHVYGVLQANQPVATPAALH